MIQPPVRQDYGGCKEVFAIPYLCQVYITNASISIKKWGDHMATAKKLPSGSYRVRAFIGIDENGKKITKSFTAPTKKQAEYLASEYLVSSRAAEASDNTPRTTFDEAMTDYINSKRNVLAPYSVTSYLSLQRTIKKCDPEFCDKNVHEITQNDVQRLINTLAKDLKQKTVRNRHGFISSVLEFSGSTLRLKTTLPKKEKNMDYIPNDADVKKLLKLVKGKELEIPIMLGAFGMLRRGEICGLEMDDIDFKKGIITVRHNMVRHPDGTFEVLSPKTYEGTRTVTVPPFVVKAIKKRGYVTNILPDTITTDFTDLVAANFEKYFTFHKLRHYGASIRLYLGVPYEYVRREGGWSSVTVLQQIYAHAFPDKQVEFADKAVQYFNNLMSKS